LRELDADVVLADIRMPRMDGVTLIRTAREEGIPALFVMMTAFASIDIAVEAMRAGAENFLVKPLEPSTVLVVLEKVLEKQRLTRAADQLRAGARQRSRSEAIGGEARVLRGVSGWVRRAAPPKAPVPPRGERGPGKELGPRRFTRSRHDGTSRSSRSPVPRC